MTSSNSINYSKYSNLNEQNIRLSTDLEIVEQNNQNQDKQLKELSVLIDKGSESKKEKDSNSFSINDLSNENNQSKQISVHNLLYGNPIDCIEPKFLGKSYAFLYDEKGNPKITIGPDCK